MQDGYPRHIVAVMGLVMNTSGRVLLVRGDRRGWEPPGGQVELGEDLVTALEREVREESGCEIEVGQLVAAYSNTGRPEEGVPEQLMLTYRCRWLSGEPCGDECMDAGWFAPEEALRIVTHPAQLAKLGDALNAGPGVRYRAYKTQPYEIQVER